MADEVDRVRAQERDLVFHAAIKDVGVVGTIAVSGLRHDLDHALIVEALTHTVGAK
jgi:uncharacterized protein (UPF0303 family)